ncbi:MAG: DinB family protein [Geminicoccaceae bacterium]
MMREHLCRMARYNQWANQRLYNACEQLSANAYHQPRPAFFGSIHGTLNHILVGDLLWLARIERKDAAALKLDDQLHDDLAALKPARIDQDEHIVALTASYGDDDIAVSITYRTVTDPQEMTAPLHLCWLHLFNHQTHHRGQIHDMLSQTEVAPPPLDLIFYLRALDQAA